jgi:hypothetical protein
MLPRLQKTILTLQTNGVTLLAKSDIAADRVPGFSLQDELKTLGTAGLTPLQVLQTATLNLAKVMGRSADYGSVVPGKIADLLSLDQDPTKDVAALQQINAIVLHGRLLSRPDLDYQLSAGHTGGRSELISQRSGNRWESRQRLSSRLQVLGRRKCLRTSLLRLDEKLAPRTNASKPSGRLAAQPSA